MTSGPNGKGLSARALVVIVAFLVLSLLSSAQGQKLVIKAGTWYVFLFQKRIATPRGLNSVLDPYSASA
jgi:hypothetical protein